MAPRRWRDPVGGKRSRWGWYQRLQLDRRQQRKSPNADQQLRFAIVVRPRGIVSVGGRGRRGRTRLFLSRNLRIRAPVRLFCPPSDLGRRPCLPHRRPSPRPRWHQRRSQSRPSPPLKRRRPPTNTSSPRLSVRRTRRRRRHLSPHPAPQRRRTRQHPPPLGILQKLRALPRRPPLRSRPFRCRCRCSCPSQRMDPFARCGLQRCCGSRGASSRGGSRCRCTLPFGCRSRGRRHRPIEIAYVPQHLP